MFRFIQTVRRTFTPAEKWGMCLLAVLLFLSSLLELAGIGAVFPVISVVVTPGSAEKFEKVTSYFGVEGSRNITIFLCCATILFFLLKNFLLFLINHYQIRFAFVISGRISADLTERYLKAPLSYYADKNSAGLLELVSQARISCSEVITSVMMVNQPTSIRPAKLNLKKVVSNMSAKGGTKEAVDRDAKGLVPRNSA